MFSWSWVELFHQCGVTAQRVPVTTIGLNSHILSSSSLSLFGSSCSSSIILPSFQFSKSITMLFFSFGLAVLSPVGTGISVHGASHYDAQFMACMGLMDGGYCAGSSHRMFARRQTGRLHSTQYQKWRRKCNGMGLFCWIQALSQSKSC